MSNTARWIWYKNDFEIYTYHKMTKRRKQRKDIIYPTWEIDRPEYQVTFFRKYNLSKDTSFKVYSSGSVVVNINDSPWNVENNTKEIKVKKGVCSIRIYCLAENTFPTVFIDSEIIKTDSSWQCYCIDAVMHNASSNDMFDSKNKSPVDYKLPEKKLNYLSKEKVNGGVLYDFGREIVARPIVKADSDVTLHLFYGESKEEAVDTANSEVCEDIVCKANTYSGAENCLGFRYVFVKNPKSVVDFYVNEEKYIRKFTPYFISNDKELNKIYKIALYTLELTSREFFIDGPKRDRWVWAGDALQSIWFDFYSFFDKDIIKRTLSAVIGKHEIRTNITAILEYNFYYVLSVYYYYYYTGDIEFIRSIYPRLESLFEFIFSKPEKDGFLMAKDEWIFIDWTDIKDFVDINLSYPIGMVQILYYSSLEAMSLFSDLVGKDGSLYVAKKTALKKRINETFFNEKYGFVHDKDLKCKTKYANIMAVLFNFANKTQQKIISANAFNSDLYEIYTPFMKFYEMCMYAELGKHDYVLNYIKEYWGGMVKLGATTFWERYNPKQSGVSHYEMYDRKYGKSLCHSWGAGPIYLIGKYIVGLSPFDVGYNKFLLKPKITGLTYKTKLATKEGYVEISFDGKSYTVFSSKQDGYLKLDERFYCDKITVDKDNGFVIKANKKYIFNFRG